MTFHQLEKVLARAATNRAFRDEIANGDADLDELGLSDDEQSVLNELVASSGAGLDAVLNVVTAVPTSAAAAPRGAPVAPAAQPAADGAPHNGSALDEVATTPAFALMTPPASAQAAQPGGPHPQPVPPSTVSTWNTAASVPTPMPATVANGQTSPVPEGRPVTMAMETHGPYAPAAPGGAVPGYAGPSYAGPGYAGTGYPGQGYPGQGMPVVLMPYLQPGPGGYAVSYAQPVPGVHPAPPQGEAEAVADPTGEGTRPKRSLDASDVGRPVVARLPFGMDVVK